jgi:hypothetical protein
MKQGQGDEGQGDGTQDKSLVYSMETVPTVSHPIVSPIEPSAPSNQSQHQHQNTTQTESVVVVLLC